LHTPAKKPRCSERVFGVLFVVARRHRNYAVFPLLAVHFFDLQQHLVLLDAELGFLPNRQQHGMLLVPRTNTVNYGLAERVLATG
jgi:hypothetical protein